MNCELEHVEKALRELGKSLKSLPPGPLPKQVHKLRTSARRVEAIAAALPHIEAKTSRRLVKSIEPLRKTAGRVRDMDVLVANLRRLARQTADDSLTRLIDHLQFVRAAGAEELQRELDHKGGRARHKLKQFAEEVQLAWPPNGSPAHANGNAAQTHNGPHRKGGNPTARHLSHELADWPPLNEQNIHDFRVEIKKLRYILQLDAKADLGLVAALGAVQRRIGDWHDWQQLAGIAHEFLASAQDRAFLSRIDEIMEKKYTHALAAANSLRRHHLTSGLPRILGC